MATYVPIQNGIIISASFVQTNFHSSIFATGVSTTYTIPAGRYAYVVGTASISSSGSLQASASFGHAGYAIQSTSAISSVKLSAQAYLPAGAVSVSGGWGNNGGSGSVSLHVIEFRNIV